MSVVDFLRVIIHEYKFCPFVMQKFKATWIRNLEKTLEIFVKK